VLHCIPCYYIEERTDILKNNIKILSAILCGTLLAGTMPVNVLADAVTGTSTSSASSKGIALGADLTDDQKQTVYEELGVDTSALDQYTTVTVTNAEEHQYLDSYVSSDLIGTKSYSSCLVKLKSGDEGIHVATSHITYCTSEMYENALVTAGVKNADVIVTAPFDVSGTAALVGVSKVYSEMTGTPLQAENVDAAADELTTTQQVADSTGDTDKTSDLIAAIKADVVNNKDMTDDEIKDKINQYASDLGLQLTDDDIQAIIDLMHHLAKTSLSADDIKSQLSSLYSELKNNGIDTGITDAQANSLIDKIATWFAGVWEKIRSIFN